MSENWEPWYAWRPVNLCHGAMGCEIASAWLTRLVRMKVGNRWIYAVPGMESMRKK
jgi:hypothetical protein